MNGEREKRKINDHTTANKIKFYQGDAERHLASCSGYFDSLIFIYLFIYLLKN